MSEQEWALYWVTYTLPGSGITKNDMVVAPDEAAAKKFFEKLELSLFDCEDEIEWNEITRLDESGGCNGYMHRIDTTFTGMESFMHDLIQQVKE